MDWETAKVLVGRLVTFIPATYGTLYLPGNVLATSISSQADITPWSWGWTGIPWWVLALRLIFLADCSITCSTAWAWSPSAPARVTWRAPFGIWMEIPWWILPFLFRALVYSLIEGASFRRGRPPCLLAGALPFALCLFLSFSAFFKSFSGSYIW